MAFFFIDRRQPSSSTDRFGSFQLLLTGQSSNALEINHCQQFSLTDSQKSCYCFKNPNTNPSSSSTTSIGSFDQSNITHQDFGQQYTLLNSPISKQPQQNRCSNSNFYSLNYLVKPNAPLPTRKQRSKSPIANESMNQMHPHHPRPFAKAPNYSQYLLAHPQLSKHSNVTTTTTTLATITNTPYMTQQHKDSRKSIITSRSHYHHQHHVNNNPMDMANSNVYLNSRVS